MFISHNLIACSQNLRTTSLLSDPEIYNSVDKKMNHLTGLPLTFKIRKFKTSSHPNQEVGLTEYEESNPKLPVFFCFKMFYGHFIKFGLHARHLVS